MVAFPAAFFVVVVLGLAGTSSNKLSADDDEVLDFLVVGVVEVVVGVVVVDFFVVVVLAVVSSSNKSVVEVVLVVAGFLAAVFLVVVGTAGISSNMESGEDEVVDLVVDLVVVDFAVAFLGFVMVEVGSLSNSLLPDKGDEFDGDGVPDLRLFNVGVIGKPSKIDVVAVDDDDVVGEDTDGDDVAGVDFGVVVFSDSDSLEKLTLLSLVVVVAPVGLLPAAGFLDGGLLPADLGLPLVM